MDRHLWYYRFKADVSWLDSFIEDIERTDTNLITSLVDSTGIGYGFVVSERAAGQNFSVDISAGNAYDESGKRIYSADVQNLPFVQDEAAATIEVVGVGNERIVSIYAVYALVDDPSSSVVDGFGDTVFTIQTEEVAFELYQGTEAGSGLATPAARPTGDRVLLANVTIRQADSTIANADIDDSTADYLGIVIGTNSVGDSEIDWGFGADQVSAVNVPVEDIGLYYAGADVEAVLAEIAVALAGDDSALAAHLADTSTHGVATIAGLTETQTFTNKTLVAPIFESFPHWTSAQQVGSSLAIATVGNPTLAALNGRDVAFIDGTNDSLRTYRFDGTNWAQVGVSLAIATVGSRPRLAALSETDVAFLDSGNNELRTYRFDGTNWAQVGNSFTMPALVNPSIAALNATDIAFTDQGTLELRTYTFDGTDWSQVGNGFALTAHGAGTALAALSETDVAYCDSTNDILQRYTFDGTDWSQVGNGLVITGAGPEQMTGLNSTDIAFIETTSDELKIYRFDESDWAQVGGVLDIAGVGSVVGLTMLNGTDMAFIDSSNLELRTYRFGFSITKPYSVAGGAF